MLGSVAGSVVSRTLGLLPIQGKRDVLCVILIVIDILMVFRVCFGVFSVTSRRSFLTFIRRRWRRLFV